MSKKDLSEDETESHDNLLIDSLKNKLSIIAEINKHDENEIVENEWLGLTAIDGIDLIAHQK
jgi:hypothetical protein